MGRKFDWLLQMPNKWIWGGVVMYELITTMVDEYKKIISEKDN